MKSATIEDMLNDKGYAIATAEDTKTFLRLTADELIRQAIAGDTEEVGGAIDDLIGMIRMIKQQGWAYCYIEEHPMAESNLNVKEAGAI